MTESLATAVEQNSTAIEQMSRSVQSVAANGAPISDAATNASRQRRPARSLDPVGRRRSPSRPTKSRGGSSRDAEDGGATVQRSIQGIGRLRDSMLQSATVMKRDGQAHQRDRQHRRHHQPDRRAHQPAVAERLHRGGARRRRRPRIRGRGRGNPQSGRPLGQGDGRHRRRSSRRCRKWPRTRSPRPTTACASRTRATPLAEAGAGGLKKILERPRRDHRRRLADRARHGGAAGRGRRSVDVGDRHHDRTGAAGRSRDRRTGDRRRRSIAQATAQMRKTAQEVAQGDGAAGDGRPRHSQGGTEQCGSPPTSTRRRRAGAIGGGDRQAQPSPCAAARRRRTRALAEQATGAEQWSKATAALAKMIASVSRGWPNRRRPPAR